MPLPDANDFGFPTNMIHLIWFGDHIPIHYEMNLIRWVENNPKHTIHVHVGLNRENIQQLEQRFLRFTSTGRLKFIDFLETLATIMTELVNTNGEQEFVKAASHSLFDEISLPHGNFAAASDILRLILLYFFGGWYVDFDAIPNLKTKISARQIVEEKSYLYCFKQKTASFLPLAKNYPLKFGLQFRKAPRLNSVCNDLLVSKPRSILVKKVLKQIIKNYQDVTTGMKLSTTAYFALRFPHLRHWILHLTGPNVLVEALGDKGNGDLATTDPAYLIDNHITANIAFSSDQTWLPHGISAMKLVELRMRIYAYKMQRLLRENKVSSKFDASRQQLM